MKRRHILGGAGIADTQTCVCGMAPEEHGHDPTHPTWTGCEESGCCAYEPDEDDPAPKSGEEKKP